LVFNVSEGAILSFKFRLDPGKVVLLDISIPIHSMHKPKIAARTKKTILFFFIAIFRETLITLRCLSLPKLKDNLRIRNLKVPQNERLIQFIQNGGGCLLKKKHKTTFIYFEIHKFDCYIHLTAI
jgi:hypothetical protein